MMKLISFLELGLLSGLLVSCRKDTPQPPMMDPAEERRAIELREEADRRTAALKDAAALREAELKKAIIKDANLQQSDKAGEPVQSAPRPPLK